MLSRNAQGLYWMGRYLERAEHMCRLLALQVEAMVDRPVREILFGWNRLYTTLGRSPPGGAIDLDADDDYTMADSFTLADDLTFERANPDSVWSCFALGRENARQMRHCLNAEMWTCLNLAYLGIRERGIEQIWRVSPESFYTETARQIDTFTGVADATMYRDLGWRFMRLGRFIERAQFLLSLLLAQRAADRAQNEAAGIGWTGLLRARQAFEAYERNYSVEVRPRQALDLLVTDPSLPGSLCYSLDTAAAELAAIALAGAGAGAQTAAAAKRFTGRLGGMLRYEWPDREDREDLLAQAQRHCRDLHDLIIAAYVDYAVEDRPDIAP
ncbi:MAG: alpha-E domain-containing protein [bacterium]